MKNVIFFLFVFVSQNLNYESQIDFREKILGQWIFDKTKSVEQLSNGVFADRESGLVKKDLTVYFKTDNTGNFNFENKDSETFTWVMKNKKMSINYIGENTLYKSFNGEFKVVLKSKSKSMELIRNNFSISLSR